jgi:hypothetical protein
MVCENALSFNLKFNSFGLGGSVIITASIGE